MSNAPPRQAASIDMAAGFRPRAVALLFVALMAVAIIPVLSHRLPPLSDYVNHLARVHVINEIGEDPNLSRFYSIDWAIIPNLMIDLVVPWLSEVMNVYAAGQTFTVLSFLLIVSGTLALNRALFGRWSVLPLIAIPLLYNGVLLVGVMNYVFGIGLALWALAGWVMIAMSTRSNTLDWSWEAPGGVRTVGTGSSGPRVARNGAMTSVRVVVGAAIAMCSNLPIAMVSAASSAAAAREIRSRAKGRNCLPAELRTSRPLPRANNSTESALSSWRSCLDSEGWLT